MRYNWPFVRVLVAVDVSYLLSFCVPALLFFLFIKSEPNLYLADNDFNDIMICDIFRTVPFLGRKSTLLKRK